MAAEMVTSGRTSPWPKPWTICHTAYSMERGEAIAAAINFFLATSLFCSAPVLVFFSHLMLLLLLLCSLLPPLRCVTQPLLCYRSTVRFLPPFPLPALVSSMSVSSTIVDAPVLWIDLKKTSNKSLWPVLKRSPRSLGDHHHIEHYQDYSSVFGPFSSFTSNCQIFSFVICWSVRWRPFVLRSGEMRAEHRSADRPRPQVTGVSENRRSSYVFVMGTKSREANGASDGHTLRRKKGPFNGRFFISTILNHILQAKFRWSKWE